MLKFVLLSCLLAAALAKPHHTPGHQHDAEEKVQAAEPQTKPLDSETKTKAEAEVEEHKEAAAEVLKPEADLKPDATSSSDSVTKEKETPVVSADHAHKHADTLAARS